MSVVSGSRTDCRLLSRLLLGCALATFTGPIASADEPRPPAVDYVQADAATGRIPPAPEDGSLQQSTDQAANPGTGQFTPAQQHLIALTSLERQEIDLASALALVGVRNPEFLAAQQRTLEAAALRQLAAVRFLPTLNLGTSLDSHTGNLQQSSGNILSVSRQAFFLGAGANAIAAGTVNVPGVLWELNVSEAVYAALASRQVVAERQWAVAAARNELELLVAEDYLDLLLAAGLLRVGQDSREKLATVYDLTSAFAKVGQGRPADAARAASELAARNAELLTLQGEMLSASARLAEQLGLDTSIQLIPKDPWIVPHSIVPEPLPLQELLVIALLQRPELQERQAAIRATLLELEGAKKLPFSPTVFMGFSTGMFGGGSNLASDPVGSGFFARGQDRFGNFQNRTDFDAMVYWTLRNLGIGNQAQIEAAASRLRQSQWEQVIVYDQIRAQVAAAYTRLHARSIQLMTAEKAIGIAQVGWEEDLRRTRGNEGLPIEVLDSQELLYRAQAEYLRTIIDYNRAQFELYQALGRPPADMLVRYASPAIPAEPPAQVPPAE